MNQLEKLMKLPYSLVIMDSSVEIVELGLKASTLEGYESAFKALGKAKEEYFKNMLSHDAAHLIPQPLIWKKSFFPIESLNLKKWIIKCAVATLFLIIAVSICVSFVSKSLNRSIEKLDEVINPVIKDETKKVNLLKKNLEKYRPYIREVVKVMEEEKNKPN